MGRSKRPSPWRIEPLLGGALFDQLDGSFGAMTPHDPKLLALHLIVGNEEVLDYMDSRKPQDGLAAGMFPLEMVVRLLRLGE